MSFHGMESAPSLYPREGSKGSRNPRAWEETSSLRLTPMAQQREPSFHLR